MNTAFYIFLTGTLNRPNPETQQYLPYELSNFGKVTAIEYPQFIKLIRYVFKINPLIKRLNDNLLIIMSFGLLPFGRSFSIVNKLNFLLLKNQLVKRLSRHDVTDIITFTPELYLLKDLFNNKHFFYYVIDDYLSYPCWRNSLQRTQFIYLESKFLPLCTAVIVSSLPLLEKYKNRHKRVIYFPNPANLKPFFVKGGNKIPPDIKKIPHPIIGYTGDIEAYRINFDLIQKAIRKYSQYSFVFIGPIGIGDKSTFKYIPKGKNTYYLSTKKHDELPSYINQFDVCLIPFLLSQYGKMSFPVKTFEYLAMGKPVVSTALPSIKHLAEKGLIYWAKNDYQFLEYIVTALKEENTEDLIERRVVEAGKNDWSLRIKDFFKIINN